MAAFFKHVPVGLLGQYVESFWYRPAAPSPGGGTGMLVLPAGHAELVISLGGSAQSTWTSPGPGERQRQLHCATVRLPHHAPVATVLSSTEAAFGVSFKPHGLRHFSSLALDIGDEMTPMSAFWRGRADELIERLAEAATPAARFGLMEAWLLQHLREPHRAHHQVARAARLLSNPECAHSVDAIARDVGLSPRRMLSLFREDLGLTPKAFARVMRFNAALRLARAPGPMRWTDVAAACHYFDQAHFVREFRELAGMTPTRYLECRTTGHANCLPWVPPAPRSEPERLRGLGAIEPAMRAAQIAFT